MLLCQSIRQVPLLRFSSLFSFLPLRISHICRLIWSFCFFSIGRHYCLIYFVFSTSLRAVSSERRRHTHTHKRSHQNAPYISVAPECASVCVCVCFCLHKCVPSHTRTHRYRRQIHAHRSVFFSSLVWILLVVVCRFNHHCPANIPLHCVYISIMFKLMVQILMWHTHFSACIISMSVLWIKANLPVLCDLHCAYFSIFFSSNSHCYTRMWWRSCGRPMCAKIFSLSRWNSIFDLPIK